MKGYGTQTGALNPEAVVNTVWLPFLMSHPCHKQVSYFKRTKTTDLEKKFACNHLAAYVLLKLNNCMWY